MNKKARISYSLIVSFCIVLSMSWAESRKQLVVASAKESISEVTTLETVTSENPKPTPAITKKVIKTTYYEVPVSKQDQDFIKKVCHYYDFSSKLIYQIMFKESSFNPKSSNGVCYGIMQIHGSYYKTYLRLNKDGFNYIFNGSLDNFDIYNIRHNVLIAIRMLDSSRNFCEIYGLDGIKPVLQCYNQGNMGYLHSRQTGYSNRVLSTRIESYVIERVEYEKSISNLQQGRNTNSTIS